MKFICLVAFVSGLFCLTHSASAQQNADVSSLQIATEIIRLQHEHDHYAQKLEAYVEPYTSLIMRDNPDNKDLAQKIIKETYVPALMRRNDEVEKLSAKIYAENFTQDELKNVFDFMKSPVGTKLRDLTPKLIQQGNIEGHDLRADIRQKALDLLTEALKKNNLKIPEEIAVWEKNK